MRVQRGMTVMSFGVGKGRGVVMGEATVDGMAPVMIWFNATVL